MSQCTDASTQLAHVSTSTVGVQITRFQQNHPPAEWRVMPWHDVSRPEVDELAAFLRGCLADAYHKGRTDAMESISKRAITQHLFDAQACPDGGGEACNYCKTDAVMAYLASVILTAH